MKKNLDPFPEIETEKLLLRRVMEDDMYDIFNMRKEPSIHEYTDTRPDENLDDTIEYISRMNKGIDENRWILWGIQDKDSGRIVGTISVWNFDEGKETAELGFGIVPEFRGKGLMTDALRKVVSYTFNVQELKIIEAFTEEENLKSRSLLERCGFVENRRVIDQSPYDGKEYHMVVYERSHPSLI